MALTIKGREYTLRPLKTKDVFAISRILGKMGLRPKLAAGASGEQLGADLLVQVMSALGEAESEIGEWLADLINMPAAELADLDLEDFALVLAELRGLPGIGLFFRRALALSQ